MQKKRIKFFSNCKTKHEKKKHEIIFKTKEAKKAGGVYTPSSFLTLFYFNIPLFFNDF